MFRELDELKKWLTVLFVIVLLTGGCSVNEVRLNDSHTGMQKELTRDQVLFVTLESNPTTGYSWQVAEIDKAVLRQVGNSEYKSSASGNPPVVGAGGAETFRFETVSAGNSTLKLVYRRPWEKDVPPIKTYTLQIAVR